MKKQIADLTKYRPGRLAKNTIVSLIWQGIRIALQALWMLLIARLLAPEGYGDFSGLAGLATMLGGFCGLGLGLVMYQEVARDPSRFGAYWRNAMRFTVGSGALFALVFVPVAGHLVYQHLALATVAAIGMAELLFFPIVTLCAFAFAAHEKFGYSTGIPALMSATRLVAAFGFWLSPFQHDLATYAMFHLCASTVGALAAYILTVKKLRPKLQYARASLKDIREGIGFSALWASSLALTSADKSLVLHFAGNWVAGLYTAAYRFATIFAQPMDALTSAAMPRLFRNASDSRSSRLLLQLALAVFGYAVIAGAVLAAISSLLPVLSGNAFSPAVPATRWMALFLPCYGLRVLGINILMASGQKSIRLTVDTIGLFAMFMLSLYCLPKFGLYGAVIMITGTELLMATLLWLCIWLDKKVPPSSVLSS